MTRTPSLLLSLQLLLLLLTWQQALAREHVKWNHSNTEAWASQFPRFCSGRKQSPVNLGVSISNFADIQEFDVKQTEPPRYQLEIVNDGHTLIIRLPAAVSIQMGLGQQMFYRAAQLHWHWGLADERGSEHTVDGRAYPMEGHLVFWNNKDYDDFSKAVHSVGGLAVLGVLHQKSELDNPLIKAIEPAIASVRDGGAANVSVNASTFDLVQAFLPSTVKQFYRYEGSLTTPECTENVLWTVFKDAAPVSERQLQLLRSLRYGNKSPMGDNFRLTQPLNSGKRPGADRQLYRTFGSDQRGVGVLPGDNGDGCGAEATAPATAALAVGVAAVGAVWQLLRM